MIYTLCLPPTPYYKSTTPPPPPHLFHPPIVCNKIMEMAFLVQMTQSNKCWSVRNGEIINLDFLDLGSGAGPSVSIPCLLQDTSHIHWFHPPKTINQEKTKKTEMTSNFQEIKSYCLGLRTQNPGLREVDLEPSPKRGSDKINMETQGRNTQKKASHILQPGLTYGS